jgi:hypothetical protein
MLNCASYWTLYYRTLLGKRKDPTRGSRGGDAYSFAFSSAPGATTSHAGSQLDEEIVNILLARRCQSFASE